MEGASQVLPLSQAVGFSQTVGNSKWETKHWTKAAQDWVSGFSVSCAHRSQAETSCRTDAARIRYTRPEPANWVFKWENICQVLRLRTKRVIESDEKTTAMDFESKKAATRTSNSIKLRGFAPCCCQTTHSVGSASSWTLCGYFRIFLSGSFFASSGVVNRQHLITFAPTSPTATTCFKQIVCSQEYTNLQPQVFRNSVPKVQATNSN